MPAVISQHHRDASSETSPGKVIKMKNNVILFLFPLAAWICSDIKILTWSCCQLVHVVGRSASPTTNGGRTAAVFCRPFQVCVIASRSAVCTDATRGTSDRRARVPLGDIFHPLIAFFMLHWARICTRPTMAFFKRPSSTFVVDVGICRVRLPPHKSICFTDREDPCVRTTLLRTMIQFFPGTDAQWDWMCEIIRSSDYGLPILSSDTSKAEVLN